MNTDWYIEWGHDYNLLADSLFVSDRDMEAIFNQLGGRGWAYISATYIGPVS
jgi:hypothetical protein